MTTGHGHEHAGGPVEGRLSGVAVAVATTPPRATNFDEIDPPSREKILDCVHCGLCLPTCPTYAVLGTEMDSPRGRVYLIRQVQEGKLGITDAFVDHMYKCLVCRACETACPSGVQFGSIMERARGQIERHWKRPLRSRLGRWLGFRVVLPNQRALRAAVTLMGLYQRTGLQALVRKSGLLRLLGSLGEAEQLLPDIPPASERRPLPEFTPARGERRGRVALLAGCIMQELFQATNRATVRVLAENGWDVVVPREQGCCGALHVHEGELEHGKRLARRDVAVFEALEGVDHVVVNAAGCGSVMKEWGELLEHDPAWAARARRVAAKVRDVSEVLAQGGPLRGRLGRLDLTVAYHEACHLAHAQKVRQDPRALLGTIPGVTLREIRESDWCCGSAGVYNVVYTDLSLRILDRKMARIGETRADVLATGNPGCVIQIRKGMERAGLSMPVVHPVELLARAYEAGERDGAGAESPGPAAAGATRFSA